MTESEPDQEDMVEREKVDEIVSEYQQWVNELALLSCCACGMLFLILGTALGYSLGYSLPSLIVAPLIVFKEALGPSAMLVVLMLYFTGFVFLIQPMKNRFPMGGAD